MDDEFLDYWEDDPARPRSDDGWLSIYTLPPLAAVLISLVLGAFMIQYAQNRLEGVDLARLTSALQPENPPEVEFSFNPGDGASNEVQTSPNGAGAVGIAPLFTSTVQYWSADILEWSPEWGIDPNLAATVMQIESCGHPQVSSSAGAVGLFQVMPYHFKAGEDPQDPDTNAYRGLSYLSRALEAHNGSAYYALAGYNAGIGGSQRGEAFWPAETLRYVYWGSGIYADAQAGKAQSDRLDEWLAAGGAGLCSRAADFLGIP